MEKPDLKEVEKTEKTSQPRTLKKPRHPFRRKPKAEAPATQLKKVEELFDASRARLRASNDAGILSVANFTDALLARIDIARGLDILESQLQAETTIFDLNANMLVTKADGSTRQKALELYFNYLLGKPVERKIIEQHNIDSLDDLGKKLAGNPALCETLQEMIKKAREGANPPSPMPPG
jgi:hypothetical protein